MEKNPLHVFIIPDGNRRWAKEKEILPTEGHRKGQEVFRSIIKEIGPLGVTHLTIWGLSEDNLQNRSKFEISVLTEIFRETFDELLSSKKVEEEKLRVRVAGRYRKHFNQPLIQTIEKLEKKTADYNGKNLTLLLAYNGDDELVDAINKFRNFDPYPCTGAINWGNIRNWLWTRFLPDVDIMIRTGFEAHLSGAALLMQMANAHLYFPKMHWPDFNIDELAKIIDDFKNRERRFGA